MIWGTLRVAAVRVAGLQVSCRFPGFRVSRFLTLALTLFLTLALTLKIEPRKLVKT